MTNINNIRTLLASGKITIGSWLQINSADIAEILAQAGYDWIAVDMEHGAFSQSDLPNIFRAIECAKAVPFVRLMEADPINIKYALDAGAHGLIFPRIESYEQLNAAIHHTLYPHLGGERGFGYCRANSYGKNFYQYNDGLAKDIFIVAQIEHINAVNNLKSIISHPRLDAIMVGPYDLSGSMNIVGQFDNPNFINAMKNIFQICKANNMVMGTHLAQPDQQALASCVQQGYRFIAYGTDTVFLWQGAKRPSVC